MKKKIPLVSVLLLSYNHEEFIEEAIKSVFALKSIDYEVELRIIDDGSTDKTQTIINSLKEISPISMYVKFKTHTGITAISKNLNELIFDAKGELITFLASDDFFIKENFLKRLNILKEDAKLKLVYSNGINIQDGIKTTKVITEKMISLLETHNSKKVYNYLISNVPSLYIQGLIIRSEILRDIGGFDEDLIADDWVLNIKIFKYLYENNYEYKFYDMDAFFRNIHETNTSRDMEGHFKRVSQVINKYYDENNKKYALSKLYWSFGVIYLIKMKITRGIVYLLRGRSYAFDSMLKRIKVKK